MSEGKNEQPQVEPQVEQQVEQKDVTIENKPTPKETPKNKKDKKPEEVSSQSAHDMMSLVAKNLQPLLNASVKEMIKDFGTAVKYIANKLNPLKDTPSPEKELTSKFSKTQETIDNTVDKTESSQLETEQKVENDNQDNKNSQNVPK